MLRRDSASCRGFTLVELAIVVAIVAIILAIAIPSLERSRKAANDAKAISSLRAIYAAMEMRRIRTGTYFGGIALLEPQGFLSGFKTVNLNQMDKSGYRFTRTNLNGKWRINADPLQPGTTGDRYFFIMVEDGVIRFETLRPATASSPPID